MVASRIRLTGCLPHWATHTHLNNEIVLPVTAWKNILAAILSRSCYRQTGNITNRLSDLNYCHGMRYIPYASRGHFGVPSPFLSLNTSKMVAVEFSWAAFQIHSAHHAMWKFHFSTMTISICRP